MEDVNTKAMLDKLELFENVISDISGAGSSGAIKGYGSSAISSIFKALNSSGGSHDYSGSSSSSGGGGSSSSSGGSSAGGSSGGGFR